MNRILTGLLCLAMFQANAQEGIIDSIKQGSFTGIHQAGEMGGIVYVPYFTSNKKAKKNFIISQLNGESLLEEKEIRLELPESYTLKHSSTNGTAYLLCFYDAAKKEHVTILTTEGGNINGKITSKANGSQVIPLVGSSPEAVALATIDKKGAYKISMYNMSLEPIWEKSFKPTTGTWQVININSGWEGLSVMRKENLGNNKYTFTLHKIQQENGETIAENKLKNGELICYPNFHKVHEGVGILGGVYYNNGIYNAKTPDGVFATTLTPDGQMEQLMKVPYSQVIEEVKNTVGGALTSGDAGILFTSGIYSHETQGIILIGEVYSIAKNDDKGGTVTLKDMVVVIFGGEQGKFKRAYAIKTPKRTLTINGDLSTTNNVDIANWLGASSLTRFKFFAANSPFAFAYITEHEGRDNICHRGTFIENDSMAPACFEITQMLQNPPKSYSFYKDEMLTTPTQIHGVIANPMSVEKTTTYELDKQLLFIRRVPAPSVEDYIVELMQEEPEEEPMEEDEQTEEEDTEQEEAEQ